MFSSQPTVIDIYYLSDAQILTILSCEALTIQYNTRSFKNSLCLIQSVECFPRQTLDLTLFLDPDCSISIMGFDVPV